VIEIVQLESYGAAAGRAPEFLKKRSREGKMRKAPVVDAVVFVIRGCRNLTAGSYYVRPVKFCCRKNSTRIRSRDQYRKEIIPTPKI
jgi:hypothetical protein